MRSFDPDSKKQKIAAFGSSYGRGGSKYAVRLAPARKKA